MTVAKLAGEMMASVTFVPATGWRLVRAYQGYEGPLESGRAGPTFDGQPFPPDADLFYETPIMAFVCGVNGEGVIETYPLIPDDWPQYPYVYDDDHLKDVIGYLGPGEHADSDYREEAIRMIEAYRKQQAVKAQEREEGERVRDS